MGNVNGRGPKFDNKAERRFIYAVLLGDGEATNSMVAYGPRSENRRSDCVRIISSFLRRGGELPLPSIWDEYSDDKSEVQSDKSPDLYAEFSDFPVASHYSNDPELDGTCIPKADRWQEFSSHSYFSAPQYAGGFVCSAALGI